MNKIYTRINWENYPSEATALNETNLNKMDFALDEVDNRLIEQDTTKLSKTDASNDVVNWTMDEETGVITVTRRSGEQIIFDLNIEKIPVSFFYHMLEYLQWLLMTEQHLQLISVP